MNFFSSFSILQATIQLSSAKVKNWNKTLPEDGIHNFAETGTKENKQMPGKRENICCVYLIYQFSKKKILICEFRLIYLINFNEVFQVSNKKFHKTAFFLTTPKMFSCRDKI